MADNLRALSSLAKGKIAAIQPLRRACPYDYVPRPSPGLAPAGR